MIPCACLNPKKVFNQTLGHWITVPCGHCDACLNSKGFNLSNRLGESMARFKHRYFVTLTFSDEHLPLAKYDDLTGRFIHPFDYDYYGEFYSVSYDVFKSSLNDTIFKDVFYKYHGIPVLSHRLLINYKKRLRKNFANFYGKEYLFIYAVGEYGATYYRPHYHLILCTNADISASVLKGCVCEAWSHYDKATKKYLYQYGRIDFQRIISKGIRSYVSQYLNCYTSLPPVYSSGLFKSFYQSSPLIDSDQLRFGNVCNEKLFFECNPEKVSISLLDNRESIDVLPIGIINRVFPKCPSFSSLSHSRRVQLYSIFERQPYQNAEDFASAIIDGFFFKGDDFGYLIYNFVDSDIFASKLRLKKLFYISRKVCLSSRSFGVTLDFYVSQIELFWSRFELLKLKKFYELQESLLTDNLNPCSVSDLFSLYYDTDDRLKNLFYYYDLFGLSDKVCSVDNFASQKNYRLLMKTILSNTTKTKKRNDYFIKNGFVRPSNFSRLKNNKLCRKFFQI